MDYINIRKIQVDKMIKIDINKKRCIILYLNILIWTWEIFQQPYIIILGTWNLKFKIKKTAILSLGIRIK